MTFITARDLRLKAAEIWDQLEKEGEIIVTVNGHPRAIITGVSSDNLEESLLLLKKLRAESAVAKMRQTAVKRGLSKLSCKMIQREIKAARKGRP